MKILRSVLAFVLSLTMMTPALAQGYWPSGGGSGTVSSFSAGPLSPLFTCTVSNATSTPSLSFTLSSAAAGSIFCNATGSSGVPSYFAPGTADQILGAAHTGGGLEYKTVTAGSGIIVTPTSGVLTITNNGLLSISGGSAVSNQFVTSLTNSAGALSVTLAQPAFSNLTGSAILAQFPTQAQNTVLGSIASGSQVPVALTAAQLTAIPNLATTAVQGMSPALTSGQIAVGQSSGSIAAETLSGDATIAATGALTIKTNVALAGSPTTTTQSQGDSSVKISTTSYVDTAVANALAGVNPAVAVQAATTTILPNTPTYANGATGIGATLTSSSNVSLVTDGYTGVTGDAYLVKNQASGLQNGVFTLVQGIGSVSPWVLTRRLDYDQPSDINNTGSIPVINGTINGSTSWVQTAKITTVGTDSLAFTQFSINPTTLVTTSRQILAGTGLSGGGDLSADRTLTNTGVTSNVAGTGINVSGATGAVTITLANTAVSPATYTNATLTVDQQGRLTSASSGAAGASSNAKTAANSNVMVPGPILRGDGVLQGLPDICGFSPGTIYEYLLSNNPQYICAGPDGNLWATENSGGVSRIAKITPTGVITEYTSGLTSGCDPQYICTGPDGNLWFCEFSNSAVGKVTPSGTITEYTTTTAGSHPWGICSGPDGNLWFTEDGGNNIGKITTAGTITEYAVTTSSSNPFDICAGPDGNLWFIETATAANNIGKITTAGTITEYSSGLTANAWAGSPGGICTGPDGNLWFGEYNKAKVGKITTSGTVTEYADTTTHPSGICAGPDGNLWVASNFSANNLTRVSTLGAVTIFNGGITGSFPNGICTGPDGNLWFGESNSVKVGVLPMTKTMGSITLNSPLPFASGGTSDLWGLGAVGGSVQRFMSWQCVGPNGSTMNGTGAGNMTQNISGGTANTDLNYNGRQGIELVTSAANANISSYTTSTGGEAEFRHGPVFAVSIVPYLTGIYTAGRIGFGLAGNPANCLASTFLNCVTVSFLPGTDTYWQLHVANGSTVTSTSLTNAPVPVDQVPTDFAFDCSDATNVKLWIFNTTSNQWTQYYSASTTAPPAATQMSPFMGIYNISSGSTQSKVGILKASLSIK